MKQAVSERGYTPDCIVVCPGGAEAVFLRKEGNELYWRGKLPYGMYICGEGWWCRYIVVTDLAGNMIRTESIRKENTRRKVT
jgi:hypothetical protein